MSAISVIDLVKAYRFHRKEPGLRGSLKSLVRRQMLETRAVDGVSFNIAPGEVVGFLGPNGAGKTTTLKVLCGLLYPTAGVVTVLGHTPVRREPAYLRQIALVMGQKNMLWWDLPAMETLLLHKEIYRLGTAEFHRNLNMLAEMLEVGQLLVGIYRIAEGLVNMQIAPNMQAVWGYIRNGELDFILLRPASSQFLISTRRLQPHEALNALIGVGLTIYAGNLAGVRWSALGIVEAVAFGFCGLLLLYAVWFLTITGLFWTQAGNQDEIIPSLFQTARYPVSFFKGLARALLTFVIPAAFATTFPAQALLGEADRRMLLAGIGLSISALLATYVCWNYALRHYSSASS